MFVRPESRGTGIGKAILQFLEDEARATGFRELRLETGDRQPEAIALYARAGYQPCSPFGNYPDDPFSVFMSKMISGIALKR